MLWSGRLAAVADDRQGLLTWHRRTLLLAQEKSKWKPVSLIGRQAALQGMPCRDQASFRLMAPRPPAGTCLRWSQSKADSEGVAGEGLPAGPTGGTSPVKSVLWPEPSLYLTWKEAGQLTASIPHRPPSKDVQNRMTLSSKSPTSAPHIWVGFWFLVEFSFLPSHGPLGIPYIPGISGLRYALRNESPLYISSSKCWRFLKYPGPYKWQVGVFSLAVTCFQFNPSHFDIPRFTDWLKQVTEWVVGF